MSEETSNPGPGDQPLAAEAAPQAQMQPQPLKVDEPVYDVIEKGSDQGTIETRPSYPDESR